MAANDIYRALLAVETSPIACVPLSPGCAPRSRPIRASCRRSGGVRRRAAAGRRIKDGNRRQPRRLDERRRRPGGASRPPAECWHGNSHDLSVTRPALPNPAPRRLSAAVLLPAPGPSMAAHQVELRTVPRRWGVPRQWLFVPLSRQSGKHRESAGWLQAAILHRTAARINLLKIPVDETLQNS